METTKQPRAVKSKYEESYFYEYKYEYVSSVTSIQTDFTQIPYYTHYIELLPMQYLTVKIKIPFVGNDLAGKRSRILLKFDGEVIDQSAKYNTKQWELNDLVLEGMVFEIGQGKHMIEIFACVDGGTLNIPHYNTSLIEATKLPKLQGKLSIKGKILLQE